MACKGRYTPLGFKIQKEEIQMRNLKRTLSLVMAMALLKPGRMIADEGVRGALRIMRNVARDKDLRERRRRADRPAG